jgi:isoleucyl-tRNA synthetase
MELVPEGFTCPHCGGKDFDKETDTLDCWFDSGSTHFASLMKDTPALWPADVYLEGADQYRGWFQSSLLTSVGALDQGAPFRQVLTHGWVVDGQGRAMHKSLGNGVDPADLIKDFGADIVRLWAASSDYHADVRCSKEIFKQLSESYRKIRNTARIILANLGDNGCDFDPDLHMVSPEQYEEIDLWILARFNELVKRVTESYNNYEFHIVYHEILNFCTVDLSKIYIDVTKDRVYTEKADSVKRRAAQSAMFTVLDGLVRLIAPILAFTADEIWQIMPHRKTDDALHVVLNDLPVYDESCPYSALAEKYDAFFLLRDDVLKALENARNDKIIGKSLEASVTVYTTDDKTAALLEDLKDQLATLLIVSEAIVKKEEAPEGAFAGQSGIAVVAAAAEGCKCDRCWTVAKEGKATEEDGFLCIRCLENIQ